MISSKHLLLSAVLLIMASTARSQEDSLLDYYPLQIGNIWQYKSAAMAWGEVDPCPYYTVTVRDDTLLQNGKTYRIIDCSKYRDVHPHLQRIDSATYEFFAYDTSAGGSEFKIDSLLAEPWVLGSTFSGCRLHSIKITFLAPADTGLFFGLRLPSRHYATLEGLAGLRSIKYTLTKRLGLMSISDGVYDDPTGATVGVRDELVYAKIDGKEFGTLVSVNKMNEVPEQFKLYQNYPNPFIPPRP